MSLPIFFKQPSNAIYFNAALVLVLVAILFLPLRLAANSLMDARHMPVEWTGVDAAAIVVGGTDPGGPSRGLSLTLASVTAGPSSAYPKISICDRAFSGSGGSLQDVVGRGAGPLGPFTGYATILKNSRFLRPAQLLLDECCSSLIASKFSKRCCGTADPLSEKDSESIGCASASSTSALHGLAPEAARVEQASAGTTSTASFKIHRPEFQQKKAKLLQMQEEELGQLYEQEQNLEKAIEYFERAADLFHSEVVTTSANHCNQNQGSREQCCLLHSLSEAYLDMVGTCSCVEEEFLFLPCFWVQFHHCAWWCPGDASYGP